MQKSNITNSTVTTPKDQQNSYKRPTSGSNSKIIPKDQKSKATPLKKEELKTGKETSKDDDDSSSPLTWTVLSSTVVEELNSAGDEEIGSKLASVLDIRDFKEDMRSNAILSYHVNNFQFSRDCKFNPTQQSAFFSLMKFVIEKLTERSLPINEAFSAFQKILFSHTSLNPLPESTWEVFGAVEAKKIAEFSISTAFQHMKLLQSVLNVSNDVLTEQITFEIETVSEILPLSEAITLEEFQTEMKLLEDAKRKQEEEERIRLELEIEKNRNPFACLSNDEIKQITTDVVNSSLVNLTAELEKLLEGHREKHNDIFSKILVA